MADMAIYQCKINKYFRQHSERDFKICILITSIINKNMDISKTLCDDDDDDDIQKKIWVCTRYDQKIW